MRTEPRNTRSTGDTREPRHERARPLPRRRVDAEGEQSQDWRRAGQREAYVQFEGSPARPQLAERQFVRASHHAAAHEELAKQLVRFGGHPTEYDEHDRAATDRDPQDGAPDARGGRALPQSEQDAARHADRHADRQRLRKQIRNETEANRLSCGPSGPPVTAGLKACTTAIASVTVRL
jgi:hypothetical protein